MFAPLLALLPGKSTLIAGGLAALAIAALLWRNDHLAAQRDANALAAHDARRVAEGNAQAFYAERRWSEAQLAAVARAHAGTAQAEAETRRIMDAVRAAGDAGQPIPDAFLPFLAPGAP